MNFLRDPRGYMSRARGRSLVSKGSTRHVAQPRRRRLMAEPLEPRQYLAIPQPVEDATLGVLASLRDDVRSAIYDSPRMQTVLPVIGENLREGLDMVQVFTDALYNPINSLFAGAPTETDLQNALEGINFTSADGNLTVTVDSAAVSIDNTDPTDPTLKISFVLNATHTTEDEAHFDTDSLVQVDGAEFNTSVSLHMPVEISMPYVLAGVIPTEEVLVDINSSTVSAGVSGFAAASVNMGMLGLDLGSAGMGLDVELDVEFAGADSDGNLTLAQLMGGTLGAGLNLNIVQSSLDVSLPVSTTLPGVALGPSAEISLSIPDVFAGGAPAWSFTGDLGSLSGFGNMTAGDVQGLFMQLGSMLGSFAGQLDLDGVPFVGEKISDIIDLASMITDFATQLSNDDGFTFNTFQQLAGELAGLTGLSSSALDLRYDAAGNAVLLDLDLNEAFNETILLDFTEDAGPLNIAGYAEATFAATVDFDLSVGFDLDDLPEISPGVPDTLSKRFFVPISASTGVSVSASIQASNIDLGASVANIGLRVVDGSLDFAIGTGIHLVDPGSGPDADSRLYVSEMVDPAYETYDPEDPEPDLLTLDSPTVSLSGELPLEATSADINTLLGINTSTLASRPALVVSLGTPNDITTVQVQGDAEFQALLDDFGDFSDVSMWQAVQQAVSFLSSADLEILNAQIPVINKSINEVLDFANQLLTNFGDLNTDLAGLKADIEAQLPALDAAVAAAAADTDLGATNLEKLLRLRDRINVALAQADLSGLPGDMASIGNELSRLLPTFAGVDVVSLTNLTGTISGLIPTLNSLDDRIESMFGLPDGSVALTTEDIGGQRAIKLHLVWSVSDTVAVPLDLSYDGATIPIELDTGGSLDVQAGVDLTLDLGFNLETLTPFLFDTTSATASASIDTAVPLTATVTVGGVTGVTLGGASPKYGLVSVKEKEQTNFVGTGAQTVFNFPAALSATQRDLAIVMVNGAVQETGVTVATNNVTFTSAPANGAAIEVIYPGAGGASLSLTLNDPSPDPDGVISFAEAPSALSFNIDGILEARLSVDVPIAIDEGEIRVFADLDNLGGLYVGLPDFESVLSGETLDLAAMIDAFNELLGLIEDGLESDILTSLPLIGDDLDIAAGFIGDLHAMTASLQAAIEGGEAALQSFLYTNIGSILAKADGSMATGPGDINVSVDSDRVELRLRLKGSETHSVDFDLGLDAFVFEVAANGAVDLSLNYDIDLGIGFSLTEGLYLITNTSDSDKEFEIEVEADLAMGSTLDATMFFLKVQAEEVADPGTRLFGQLGLNIDDPNNHLTLSEIGSGGFLADAEVTMTGAADINLELSAQVGFGPGIDETMPKIATDLVVHWQFLGNDGLTGQMPSVALNDVRLELGTFLSNLIGPIVESVNDFLEPIKPIIEFLQTEIPVISDVSEFLGQGSVTVLDVIGFFADAGDFDAVVDFIDMLGQVIGVIDAFSAVAGDWASTGEVFINFGDFTFGGGVDLRDAGTSVTPASGSLGGGSAESDFRSHFPTGGASAAAGDPIGTVLGAISDLERGASDIGIKFPIFTDPLRLIGLLFGQRVDLVTWDFPRLSFGMNYEQRFGPLIPPIPLFAKVFGGFELFADFGIGLDTRAFENGLNLLNGFYFRDFKDGKESPELGLTIEFGAGAELSVIIAKAGVEGGVTANLTADWNDVDEDGKLYLDELVAQWNRGPECLFDFGGSLDAFLRFYVEVGLDTWFGFITLWEKTINLVDVTIFDFSYTCPPLPPPVLAHISDGSDGYGSGTLVVHVGEHAALRQPGATDEDDKVELEKVSDGGTDYIRVKAFGLEQDYALSQINGIYINGKEESDSITVYPEVTVPATIYGGNGSDMLSGGSGNDEIHGGAEVDWIYGNAGRDKLYGDDGNDIIFGGDGSDFTIQGGAGDDQLYGEGGDDFMQGGAGNDLMYGDDQPKNSNSPPTGSGNDTMEGGDGNDHMFGAGGNDSVKGGGGLDLILLSDGNDWADGGAGDDGIHGGYGNDIIYGGDGHDILRGFGDETQGDLTDNDFIDGGEGFDDIAGQKGNDTLIGGTQSDLLLGGLGDDRMFGGWGDDILRGEEGSDYMEGGPDNDDICGQQEVDIIYGGTTLAGIGYIVLGYVDPYGHDGGFEAPSCDDPVHFVPPKLLENGKGDVYGQKYHDLNANGTHDPGEPGLRAWEILLIDSEGMLVSSMLTTTVDLDENGAIDPETEEGLYWFEDVAPGEYTLVEVPQYKPGWFQTQPKSNPVMLPQGPAYSYKLTIEENQTYYDYDFGNAKRGSITGQKFLDDNANGVRDDREVGLNTWTIQLYNLDNELVAETETQDIDLNGDQQISATTERGRYEFTDLMPGTYRIVEVQKFGYAPTAAPGLLAVSSGGKVENANFGNRPMGSIVGRKWLDLNADREMGSSEPGMPGVVIYLDTNNDGTIDDGEPMTVTMADNPLTQFDESGWYVFTLLEDDTYVVREVPPAGYYQTYPFDNAGHTVIIEGGSAATGRNFGNARLLGGIAGAKFHDQDGDGVRDSQEPGLAGWTIYLDLNHDGAWQDNEPATTTSKDGSYLFAGLEPDIYTVREVQRFGWAQTAPAGNAHVVEAKGGQTSGGHDFGNVFGTIVTGNESDDFYVMVSPQSVGAPIVLIYANTAPVGSPIFAMPVGSFSKLIFDTKGGNDSLTVDYRYGNPVPANGIDYDGGSSFDKLRLIGTGGDDVVEFGSDYAVWRSNFGRIGFVHLEYEVVDALEGNDTMHIEDTVPVSPILHGNTGDNAILVHAGRFTLVDDGMLGSTGMQVDSGALVEVATSAHLDWAHVQSLANLNILEGADKTLRLGSLTYGPQWMLDLVDNTLIVDAPTTQDAHGILIALSQEIRNARHGGLWDGYGLTSSKARPPQTSKGVGIAWGADGVVPGLAPSSVMARASWDGDSNLDRKVDTADFANLAKGYVDYVHHRDDPGFETRYTKGDFTLDNAVNTSDFAMLSKGYVAYVIDRNQGGGAALALTGTISGRSWTDWNNNGVFNAGEGLAGVTVYVDLDGDGKLGRDEPSVLTVADNSSTRPDESGMYFFGQVPDGTYIVREVIPAGMKLIDPADNANTVVIKGGSDAVGQDFLHEGKGGTISGTKWLDKNGDQERSSGEPGLAGVVIFIDANNNNELDEDERWTTTAQDNPATPTVDEAGMYSFTGLPPGGYLLREIVPDGYVQTLPDGNLWQVGVEPGQTTSGWNFGNRMNPAIFGGVKFVDYDGDSVRGPNEPTMPGVTIYIDQDDDGQFDEGEPFRVTMQDNPLTDINERGWYWFDDLPAGFYIIREVVPAGYEQTGPRMGFWAVEVAAGQPISTLDFGNRPKGGEIHGIKWRDIDGDGVRDPNEPGVAGVIIYLDLNDDGKRGDGEPFVLTMQDNPDTAIDETGRYSFVDLPPDGYYIREDYTGLEELTTPEEGFYYFRLSYGQVETGVDFGNYLPPGDVRGIKWLDLDADRVRDDSEPGLPGVTIYADLNNNGKLDPGEPWTVTQADNPATPNVNEAGTYVLPDVPAGDVVIREVLPTGHGESYPGPRLVGANMEGTMFDLNMFTGAAGNARATETGIVGMTIAPVTGRAYALTKAGDLVLVDPNNNPGSTLVIGNVGQAITEGDIDFDPTTGRLYGLYGPNRELFIIDPTTAKANVVGNLAAGLGDVSAMAFDAAGTLYVYDSAARRLAVINKANAATISTTTISGDVPTGGVAGMDFDPLTQVLYVAVGNTIGASPLLFTVNKSTGAALPIGPTTGASLSALMLVDANGQLVNVYPGRGASANFGNFEAELLPDGNDTIRGGAANDRIFGDNGTGFGPLIITTGGDDWIYGDNGEDEIHGQEEDDHLFGGNENDRIWGEDGADVLAGQLGEDLLEGGFGDDTYVFGDNPILETDTINELVGEGSDTIDMSDVAASPVKFDLRIANAERATNVGVNLANGFGGDGSANMENVIGSHTRVNELFGNDAVNSLTGGTQNDSIVGNAGNDFLFGREGNDLFTLPTGGNDFVYGDAGTQDRMDYSAAPGPVFVNAGNRTATGVAGFYDVEIITGSAHDDLFIGPDVMTQWNITGPNQGTIDKPSTIQFEGFENLQGGSSIDIFTFADGQGLTGTIDGGGNIDYLDYRPYTTSVQVDLAAGTATGTGGIMNIEAAFGGQADDLLVGDANLNGFSGEGGNDTILGGDSGDVLLGGPGDDSIEGGLGNDAIRGGEGNDQILAGDGNDTVWGDAGDDTIVADLGDDSVLGGAGVDEISGGDGNDILLGEADNDVIDGGLGNDSITGGAGDDKTAGGDGDDVFIKQDADGADADEIVEVAGGGNDTLDYTQMTTGVTVNVQANAATGVTTLGGIETILGSAAADTLIGADAPNTWSIVGPDRGSLNVTLFFDGFENLVGGSDIDEFILNAGGSISGSIDGMAGADRLNYAPRAAAVAVSLGTSTATDVAAFAGIEAFIGSAAPDSLQGPNAANTWSISGANTGNVGGAGWSSFENLIGGTLSDTFVFADAAGVSGIINGGGNTDTLDYAAYTTAITVNLASGAATGTGGVLSIERFIGGSASDTLIGPNALNQWHVTGNNAGDVSGTTFFNSFENLTGNANSDWYVPSAGMGISGTFDGGGGTNTLEYIAYATAVTVNLPLNTATNVGSVLNIQYVTGGSGNDILIGNGAANRLQGAGGNDVLVGNAGVDTVNGGAGQDLLIGGTGADQLIGGTGEDILIGGTTSHDANIANLTNIIGRWSNLANSYAARITNLKTVAPTLAPAVTVFNDGVADSLSGQGDLDWFLGQAADTRDSVVGETVDLF